MHGKSEQVGTLAISWSKTKWAHRLLAKSGTPNGKGPLLLRLFQLCGYRLKRQTMPLCSLKLFCEAPPKCV